jgi:hypothetical protein
MDGPESTVVAHGIALEQTAARVRELNEQLLQSALTAGARTLDTYERALQNLAMAVGRAGGATPFEWLTALAQMQAEFVRDVSMVYTAALRVLLD